MTLSNLLRDIKIFYDDATIIAAEPCSPISRARVINIPDDSRISSMERDGMTYFLEVAIAREFQEDWPPEQGDEAFCKLLIEYAINDA